MKTETKTEYVIECNMPDWAKPRKMRQGRKVAKYTDYGLAQAAAMRERDRWPGLKTKVMAA